MGLLSPRLWRNVAPLHAARGVRAIVLQLQTRLPMILTTAFRPPVTSPARKPREQKAPTRVLGAGPQIIGSDLNGVATRC